MSREYSFEIDGTTYKGTTASAKNQFEALHIIGSTPVITALKDNTSEMGMAVYLMQLSFENLNKLVELLVTDCVFRKQDNAPVAENFFRDDIQNYYLLIGNVLRCNLKNFWKLRLPRGKGDAKKAEQKD